MNAMNEIEIEIEEENELCSPVAQLAEHSPYKRKI